MAYTVKLQDPGKPLWRKVPGQWLINAETGQVPLIVLCRICELPSLPDIFPIVRQALPAPASSKVPLQGFLQALAYGS